MAEDYSKLSDEELLSRVGHKGPAPTTQAQPDYSKMSDEELIKGVSQPNTAADVIKGKEQEFQNNGGWKSFGKGLLSSVVDVPNNVAQGVAWGSEKLDKMAGVDPLITQDQVKGNWFDKTARGLEEPTLPNYAGRALGDVAIGTAVGGAIPKGITTAGKIGYDMLSGGLSGLATGGAPGAAMGAVGGAALSGLGRAAGLAKKPSGRTFGEDLKRVYNSGAGWAAAGMAGSAMAGLGAPIPGFVGGAAALPGIYTALRHVPQGIANGALRYGSSIGGAGVGAGVGDAYSESYGQGDSNSQPQKPYQSPGLRLRNSNLAKGINKVMDYGTRGGLLNSLFRQKNDEQY